jgi:SWI/SNF-related matrix-associated actin-dependent regulator of chromatin subfamily A-like protein 1
MHIYIYIYICIQTFFTSRVLKPDSQGRYRFGMIIQLYERFENQLRINHIQTQSIPKSVIQAVSMGTDASTITKVDDNVLSYLEERLPPLLFKALADFQKVGVHWGAHDKRGRCLIADEPGLGKTIQAIGVSWVYRGEWPLLVITPSSARYHWQAEIVKWLHGEKSNIREEDVQVLTSSNQRIRSDIQALVVSYDLADRVQDALMEVNDGCGFRVIIADECHMLKNKNTKRAKAILPMLCNAERAILLSGTPALSRPKELWSQLNVIDSRQWPSYESFVKRYCTGTSTDENSTKGASK